MKKALLRKAANALEGKVTQKINTRYDVREVTNRATRDFWKDTTTDKIAIENSKKPAGLLNDFPQEDVVAVFFWCQKCGLHFQWPHARGDHHKFTHKFKIIVRAEYEE